MQPEQSDPDKAVTGRVKENKPCVCDCPLCKPRSVSEGESGTCRKTGSWFLFVDIKIIK